MVRVKILIIEKLIINMMVLILHLSISRSVVSLCLIDLKTVFGIRPLSVVF